MAARYEFNYAVWAARYPEFAAVSPDLAASYFAEAELLWRNDGTSPNKTSSSQMLFLNMLTSHIAALYAQTQGSANPGGAQDANSAVGRVNQATEGTVSVTLDLGKNPTSSALQAFLNQTKYGLQFQAATRAYWGMLYTPGSSPSGGYAGGGSYFPGAGYGGRWR